MTPKKKRTQSPRRRGKSPVRTGATKGEYIDASIDAIQVGDDIDRDEVDRGSDKYAKNSIDIVGKSASDDDAPGKPGRRKDVKAGDRGPQTGKIKGKATKDAEKDAHSKECKANCNEALLNDTFLWDKPEPFQDLEGVPNIPVANGGSNRGEQLPSDILKQWEGIEKRTLSEFRDLVGKSEKYQIDGEVEARDFMWRGRKVHCNRFLKIDWDLKDPFKHSRIHEKIDKAWADYDKMHAKVSKDKTTEDFANRKEDRTIVEDEAEAAANDNRGESPEPEL